MNGLLVRWIEEALIKDGFTPEAAETYMELFQFVSKNGIKISHAKNSEDYPDLYGAFRKWPELVSEVLEKLSKTANLIEIRVEYYSLNVEKGYVIFEVGNTLKIEIHQD